MSLKLKLNMIYCSKFIYLLCHKIICTNYELNISVGKLTKNLRNVSKLFLLISQIINLNFDI